MAGNVDIRGAERLLDIAGSSERGDRLFSDSIFQDRVLVAPSAARLTFSLRDIGYDVESAMADLVDNSLTAGASHIAVDLHFDGAYSYVRIVDDGLGMSRNELAEAMRFGSRRNYGEGDLGRYGLGLKTASISQCRSLTVVSRRSTKRARISALELDVDHIAESDRWEMRIPQQSDSLEVARRFLSRRTGTVILWQKLDRLIDLEHADSGWNRRRLSLLGERLTRHLGMVFHRFLEGTTLTGRRVRISVNGEQVAPWNPFAPGEDVRSLPVTEYTSSSGGTIRLSRHILPPKHLFSSHDEFERLAGPRKWNRQQGLYVYRSDRLIQSGGWAGLRAADEHTKLARASLDFSTSFDEDFKIDVSKMRVMIPQALRSMMAPHINELVQLANTRYRHSSDGSPEPTHTTSGRSDVGAVGAALLAAAIEEGLVSELDRIVKRIGSADPGLVKSLGW